MSRLAGWRRPVIVALAWLPLAVEAASVAIDLKAFHADPDVVIAGDGGSATFEESALVSICAWLMTPSSAMTKSSSLPQDGRWYSIIRSSQRSTARMNSPPCCSMPIADRSPRPGDPDVREHREWQRDFRFVTPRRAAARAEFALIDLGPLGALGSKRSFELALATPVPLHRTLPLFGCALGIVVVRRRYGAVQRGAISVRRIVVRRRYRDVGQVSASF